MTIMNPQMLAHRSETMRFEVQKIPLLELKANEIRLEIEQFGLSSNNITYAALGNSLHYFSFFPVNENWSALPVWGVGCVTESNVESVPIGTRVYGFFPAAQFATLTFGKETPVGFHALRPDIPAKFDFYNQYSVAGKDPLYLSDSEDKMVVLRPLFLTGLLLADYLEVTQRMGADVVILSSAASKTSFGLSVALSHFGEKNIIGLASSQSRQSAQQIGSYREVLLYDELGQLSTSESVAYVDMSGSKSVQESLAKHLGTALRSVLSVGMTHWSEGGYGNAPELPGVRQEVFFAPGWAAQRQKEGGQAFRSKFAGGWVAQIAKASEHFRFVSKFGEASLNECIAALVAGRVPAHEAWNCSLH
jgi:hypothetical protein